ncbi:MAG: TonB-dependent receptor plug domain-containing protein, partial [Chitinophagales bacterium]|nr:TonB-dependent receptor plug domain-containing protein [Chitinophagales bacterium]
NIKDIVRNAPKVYENESTGGLSIAGARETSTLYVVDGIRIMGSTYIPLNAIAEINVFTGGIPANYGDFTGGVVEITTKGYSGVY